MIILSDASRERSFPRWHEWQVFVWAAGVDKMAQMEPPDLKLRAAGGVVRLGIGFDFIWQEVNVGFIQMTIEICAREGFPAPVICTPHELMV